MNTEVEKDFNEQAYGITLDLIFREIDMQAGKKKKSSLRLGDFTADELQDLAERGMFKSARLNKLYRKG